MTVQFKRIDHVTITVPPGKREAAREFYTQVIGLKEIAGNHPNNALWLEIAGIELHIVEEEKSRLYANHPAFEITGLKQTIAYFQEKGVNVSFSSKIEGRERFFIRDPFDNRIELLEFD
ncbi:phage portal protein [Pseudoxanthomonas sp. SGD-10]|nr:phage portal protein [Pseudoxanthomonas sp. SGD-10]